ncbi:MULTISPECIES: hypothetical protein [unclassified Helicobacter]|uniref:hypothetical protein n=1 Tax=unclassified Helicobacter TaxID=2593540 RepID=UPI0013157DA4|nr:MULTISPECIES: hypothetical protein [unclassified Helicobacter]
MFRIFVSLVLCFVWIRALDELNIEGLNLPQEQDGAVEIPSTQEQNVENIIDPIISIKPVEEENQEQDKKEPKEDIKKQEQEAKEEQINTTEINQENEKIDIPLLPQNFDGKEEIIDTTKNEAKQREEQRLRDEQAKLEEQKRLEEELMQEDQEFEGSFTQGDSQEAQGGLKSQDNKQEAIVNEKEKMDKPRVQLEETTSKKETKQESKKVSFTQEDFFELDEDDFALERQGKDYMIKVLSLDLEAFVNGKTYNEKNQVQTFGVNDNFTQIVSQDGKIQEYKFFQKSSKKNTILNNVKFPLEKIDFDTYKIVMEDTPSSFDISNCKITIKKELNAKLNQNKEVIIDLDVRRELRNTTNFKLFLNCPR